MVSGSAELGEAIDEETMEAEVADAAFELSSRSVRVLHRQGGEPAQPLGMTRDERSQSVVRAPGDMDRFGRVWNALSTRRVKREDRKRRAAFLHPLHTLLFDVQKVRAQLLPYARPG